MVITDPFSIDNLAKIFRHRVDNDFILVSRENSLLEFKTTLNLDGQTFKTMAAYANNKGGYIVFGVKPKPHTVVGLSEEKLQYIRNIDRSEISSKLDAYYHPTIEWDFIEYNYKDKPLIIFYVSESFNKPVICAKTSGDTTREGDIYFSYNARRERIKYPELRNIFDAIRKSERNDWFNLLKKATKIGIKNISVLNTLSGEISGKKGKVYLDQESLNKVKFIQEGKFSETDGDPTLKVIGEAEVVKTLPVMKTKEVKVFISANDIIMSFLNQKQVSNPADYIKQICFEVAPTLPVYYFIKQAKLNIPETISLIQSVQARGTSKKNLKARLQVTRDYAFAQPKNKATEAKQREILLEKIRQKEKNITFPQLKDVQYFLEAIRMLENIEIELEYLKEYLCPIFSKHYFESGSKIPSEIRKTLCHIDKTLFGEIT